MTKWLPCFLTKISSVISAKVKDAITQTLLNIPQTADWKRKFAKFGIIKFESNNDAVYDGPAAQVWAISSEKLNVRYY